ncbi:MAG: IPT/TIG domain-containing protein [Flammeovirgaceae bacterium]
MKRTLLASFPIITILSAFLFISQFYAIAQPVITSFSPISGQAGTSVTINGTNFNLTPSNNIVMFHASCVAFQCVDKQNGVQTHIFEMSFFFNIF